MATTTVNRCSRQLQPDGDVNGKREGSQLKAGDWIRVRTKEEILATLDQNGELDGMPFMPEMLAFCGKRFQVYKRAHKTCDTVFPVRGRRLQRTVHLSTRCDGKAHGGCQAGCLLFWKEAWLRLAPTDESVVDGAVPVKFFPGGLSTSLSNEADLGLRTMREEAGSPPAYVCQATRLPYATSKLCWWDIRQYIEDYVSGNVSAARLTSGFLFAAYHSLSEAGIGLGRPMRWLYDRLCVLWGGRPWPRKSGVIPVGGKTPELQLNLQPGEIVRVKSLDEIMKTVTLDWKNRGMIWDPEMAPFCGNTYRVLRRVNQIIDEKTGKMIVMKNPCIVLDSVVCEARYNSCRMFCPRSIYPYWREVWLERVEAAQASQATEVGAGAVIQN
jgi:hypothetical protein